MTNKDKFLKDDVDVEELTSKLIEYAYKEKEGNLFKITKGFFAQKAKPTLTEDERVILSNIDTFIVERIGRNKESHLYLWIGKENKYILVGFDKLFQFIQERRRI